MHTAVGRAVDAPWGRAHLDVSLPHCYDRNFLWIHEGGPGIDGPAVHAEAYRVLGGEGLGHLRIVAEDPLARTLAPALAGFGYREERHVVMAYSASSAPATASPVEPDEISADELAGAYERWLRTDPAVRDVGEDDAVRRELVEHQRTFGSAGAAESIVAARAGGRIVAWAKTWQRDGVAQVEDVVVQHDQRGAGLGRAVVTAATLKALEASPSLLFIVADADDWPKQLYARLGYEPVGLRRVFTLE